METEPNSFEASIVRLSIDTSVHCWPERRRHFHRGAARKLRGTGLQIRRRARQRRRRPAAQLDARLPHPLRRPQRHLPRLQEK